MESTDLEGVEAELSQHRQLSNFRGPSSISPTANHRLAGVSKLKGGGSPDFRVSTRRFGPLFT